MSQVFFFDASEMFVVFFPRNLARKIKATCGGIIWKSQVAWGIGSEQKSSLIAMLYSGARSGELSSLYLSLSVFLSVFLSSIAPHSWLSMHDIRIAIWALWKNHLISTASCAQSNPKRSPTRSPGQNYTQHMPHRACQPNQKKCVPKVHQEIPILYLIGHKLCCRLSRNPLPFSVIWEVRGYLEWQWLLSI